MATGIANNRNLGVGAVALGVGSSAKGTASMAFGSGSTHIFNYGVFNIDRVVEAIKQR